MSINPTSKTEMVLYKTSEVASEHIVRNACAPVVLQAAQMAGQAYLNHPSLVVATTASAIAAKELTPHVSPYIKRVTNPVIAITQNYPKTTAMTTSCLCAKALPFAATGEPVSVAVAGITCTAAAASLLAYLTSNPEQSES